MLSLFLLEKFKFISEKPIKLYIFTFNRSITKGRLNLTGILIWNNLLFVILNMLK